MALAEANLEVGSGSRNGVSTGMANSENNSDVRFSGHTLDKATKAKLTLENYYSNLVSQHKDRKQRWQRLEENLNSEENMTIRIRALATETRSRSKQKTGSSLIIPSKDLKALLKEDPYRKCKSFCADLVLQIAM